MDSLYRVSVIFFNLVKLSLKNIGIVPKYVKYQLVGCLVLFALNILSLLLYIVVDNWFIKPKINTFSIVVCTIYYLLYYLLLKRKGEA